MGNTWSQGKRLLFWIKNLRAAPVSPILQEYTTLWHFLHLRFLLPEKVKRFLLPSKSDPHPFVILNVEPLNQLQDDLQKGIPGSTNHQPEYENALLISANVPVSAVTVHVKDSTLVV